MTMRWMMVFLAIMLHAAHVRATPPAYTDADILALELSGQLLAPVGLAAQINVDLALIMNDYPDMADIHVMPDWVPGHITVKLDEAAWAEYLAGTFTALDALNQQYSATHLEPYHMAHYLRIDFARLYNPVMLGAIYAEAAGVLWALPNNIGGDGADITITDPGRYTYKLGWGDCLSGCIYEHFWEYTVENGVVQLVAEYGDLVVGVGDVPVGKVAWLEQNTPNPFNPITVIRYHLRERGMVSLRIHDLAGRLVRELEQAVRDPGEHTVTWDGRNDSGLGVASGVYFYQLDAGAEIQTRKMVLAR